MRKNSVLLICSNSALTPIRNKMRYLILTACILIATASSFSENTGDYFIFSKGGKELVLDWKGQMIIRPKYHYIEKINNNLWKVSINIKEDKNYKGYVYTAEEIGSDLRYKFLDENGAEISSDWYEKIEDFSEGLAAARLNAKWGFLDENGRVKIGMRYEAVHRFISGIAAAKFGGKWGFIDKNGKTLIPFNYDSHGNDFFFCDYNALKKGDKTVIVDKKGNELLFIGKNINVNSDYCLMSGHYLRLEKDGKFSISDIKKGKLEDFKYDYVDPGFSDGLLRVEDKGKWGFLDEDLKIKILPKYDLIWEFKEGLAEVRIDGKWGFINKNEEMAIKPRFEDVNDKNFVDFFNFQDGLAVAALNGKIGAINKKGEFVIKPEYDYININNMSNFVYLFNKSSNETGLANKQGKIILKPGKYTVGCCIYAHNRIFVSCKAGKADNIKCGYVDFDGNIIIEPKYDAVYFYRNDMAAVKLKNKWGFIDKKGRLVIGYKYEAVAGYGFNSKGTAAVKVGNKWGIIDKTGKYIVNPIYEDNGMIPFLSPSDYDLEDDMP